jgi:hypothetical protein
MFRLADESSKSLTLLNGYITSIPEIVGPCRISWKGTRLQICKHKNKSALAKKDTNQYPRTSCYIWISKKIELIFSVQSSISFHAKIKKTEQFLRTSKL